MEETSTTTGRGARASLVAVSLVALAVAWSVDRWAPFPTADIRRGSEEAFVRGLEPREIEAGVVQRRWAGKAVTVEFSHLPSGALRLAVALRGHRHPVVVSGDGVVVGVLLPGRSRAEYLLPGAPRGRLALRIQSETFEARGRRLGFMLDRVGLIHEPAVGPPRLSLLLAFLAPAIATLVAARAASCSAASGAALSFAVTLGQALALVPFGLVRSPHVLRLSWLLVGAAILAAWWARRATRGDGARGPAAGAFAALLLAFGVQGVAATHPCLVTSDLVFHANKVKSAAEGHLAPLSLTPHDPPYRFPYGVSFHLLLAPLYRAGVDPALAVRMGAAAASLLASAALLAALQPWGAGRAALAVAVLQLLPVTFSPVAAGNFSNVFAQALTLLFLCWWVGPSPRWPVGALLLALAATAHFGGLLVLLVLCPVLMLDDRRGRARGRLIACAAGLGLAALYYLQFLGLMTSQLPRVLEGGADGPGLASSLALQARRVVTEWGAPVVLACALGLAAARSQGSALAAPFRGLWIAGALLFLVATASPLEVRYLYALAPAVAVLGAEGIRWLWTRPGGRWASAVLLLAQAWLAARGIVQAVLFNYRSAT